MMNTLCQVRLLRRLPSTGLQSNLSALADTLDLDSDNSLVGVDVAAGNYTIPGMHASQLAIGTYVQIDDEVNPTPYTLHPKPYTPHPTPYTLQPSPYIPEPKD